MKARVTFYFAAVVALVLFLACVPSHATERRDPLILQDTPQTQAARSSSLLRAMTPATKPVQSKPRKPKAAAARGHQGVNSLSEAKDKSDTSTNSSGSGGN
jgi:hypothetical protein